MKTLS